MKCPSCKAEMVYGKTHLLYELGDERFIVVKDVPVRSGVFNFDK
jgi:YgiT-type zinc finger domain-containing protein